MAGLVPFLFGIMASHAEYVHTKRMAAWRSPEEVLKLNEAVSSPTSVGMVDFSAFNELKFAYDQLLIENTELRAVIEIMEVKTLKYTSRKESHKLEEEELKSDIEHNQSTINRLQNELHNAQHDLRMVTAKLEHKRKLFLGLQESLQANVEECLDLRKSLERSHLEHSIYQDTNIKDIEALKDSLSASLLRAETSEKKYAQTATDLDETRAEFRCRSKRYAADVLYIVTASVYKRIVGRVMRQWRACTAADVVRCVHHRQEEIVRERLRTEHSEAVDRLRVDMQSRLTATERELERAQRSRAAFTQRLFNSSRSCKLRVFGRWRNVCLHRALVGRDDMKASFSKQRLQTTQLEMKMAQLANTESSLQRKYDMTKGIGLIAMVLQNRSLRSLSLRRAYHQWSKVLMIKRCKVTEFVENYNKLSDALEREQRISSTEFTARDKAERKLSAYRNITSKMADVIRYQGTIFRCFSSWKQYTHEQKLRRIGNWPELWRLSRLCPDENERSHLTTSDVMHLSSDRAEALHRTAPTRTLTHVTPPRSGGKHIGRANISVHSGDRRPDSCRTSESNHKQRYREQQRIPSASVSDLDAYISDDAWQEPRKRPPPHAEQQEMYYITTPPHIQRLQPRDQVIRVRNEEHDRLASRMANTLIQQQNSRRSLRSGGDMDDLLQVDEMSEVLGQYDEYANDFEDDMEEGDEVYRRGGVLEGASTMTSNLSTGSLLFTGTMNSVKAGGTFASTGDFSTATKLFKKGLAAPPQSGISAESSSQGPHHNITVGERDTLTLTPAESMSLEDLGQVETFDRQVHRERGSFSPTSAPGRRGRVGGSDGSGPAGNRQIVLEKDDGIQSLHNEDVGTGVFQSAVCLLGGQVVSPAVMEGDLECVRTSLYSEHADTGEFQSATSLFSQNAQNVARRGSSEEMKLRGVGDGEYGRRRKDNPHQYS